MEDQDGTVIDPSEPGNSLNTISRVLLREWDPIGVSEIVEAQDEYENYVGPVYSILEKGGTEELVFEFLWWVETQHMGLIGQREHTERIAARLVSLRDGDG